MTTIVQISDAHFGTERPEVVRALVQLVHELRPGLALFSGDITQRARKSQFQQAARFVAELEVPVVLALPGNHDIPLFDPFARLFFPYANYAGAFGAELEPSFESNELLMLTVNTTRASRHVNGEVSARQIERVADRLRGASSQQLRIVVTHQPVHVTRNEDLHNLLRGSERAVPRWCDAGADLLVGGHIHLPYVRPVRERFAELRRRAWVVQAGTAVSQRVRGGVPNSVNVIAYDAPRQECRVERWDYDESGDAFGRVEQHCLPVDRATNSALA